MQKVKTILSIIKNGWSALILLLISLATYGQEKHETLKINWPDEYSWQIASDQKTESEQTIELIPGNKKNGEESIKATMICWKGVQYSPMEIVMNNTFNNIIKNAPKALMTLIERDKDAKNHWILFKIESIGSKTDRTSESRIYYIVQGDYSLYSNFISVKEKTLSPEFVNKWRIIFMKSELVSDNGKITPLNSSSGTQ